MLEFLRRHHKTFWIVVTAVVIISFTFWGSFSKTGHGTGAASMDDTAFTVFGHDYDFAEYNRLSRYFNIASQLRLSLLDGRIGFANAVAGFAPRFRAEEQVPRDFVFNLIVLRHALEQHGIRASDQEVKQQFRRLPVFQTNGEIDRNKLEGFENSIGMFGMRVSDVYEMVRDWLGMQKLIQVVAGNNVPDSHLVEQVYIDRNQTIQTATIPFLLEDFKKTAQVSADEIKKYYEQNKDQFRTEEKRAVSYVFFESPQGLDKLSAEERVKKNQEFSRKVEDFSNEAFAGGKFDELAKKYGVESKPAAAFSRTEPPEELKKEPELVYEIFRLKTKERRASDPVQAEKGYYFFTVTAVEESRPQELAETESKIKDLLVEQKAQEAMVKAANDVRKQIEDALKAGKNFDDAAKDAKVEPKSVADITLSDPPKDVENGYQIAARAQRTPAGSFSKQPVDTEKGVLLVFVKAKEIRKREDSTERRRNMADYLSVLARGEIFQAWFDRRREEAQVKSKLPERM